MKPKTIGIVSLGCPKNLVDTERMTARLARAGYGFARREEDADLVLINTCGFIEEAKEESIDTILAFAKRRRRGDLQGLVVAGCLVERYGGELAREIPEVDRFLSLSDEESIVEAAQDLLGGPPAGRPARPREERSLLTPFYTAYLKVSEGCSNGCSYCTIPLIRGPQRSRTVGSLLEEARELCGRGVRELIVVGQDIGGLGRDRGEPGALAALLRGLCRIPGLEWVRLMYVHPDHLAPEVIQCMASEPAILPYLDLPIQHVHRDVLARMGRTGDARSLRRKIRALREALPGLVLRTTLMVGFPGETPPAFAELRDFVEEIRFDHLGVFAYSREEGTPAARFADQVDEETKRERRSRLLELQGRIAAEKNRERVGRRLSVLVEGVSPETDLLLCGRHYGQAPEVDGRVLINRGEAAAGEFHEVRITDAHTYDLVGEIVKAAKRPSEQDARRPVC